jgi:16S rRNA C1402 (ribose-2'-O) methylase RsmI
LILRCRKFQCKKIKFVASIIVEPLTAVAWSFSTVKTIAQTEQGEKFIESAIELYTAKEAQGEYTLIVVGAIVNAAVLTEDQLKAEMRRLLDAGESRSSISKQLALPTDFPKRQLYQWALELPDV